MNIIMQYLLEPLRITYNPLGPVHLRVLFPNVVGNFEMKPGVIQLLPKFHGLDFENPYLHLKEFDEVCATLQYNNVTDDVVRLKLFPYTTLFRSHLLPCSNGIRPQGV